MRTIYTIYKYTNRCNDKVYIGQTSKSLKERAGTNGKNYCECSRFYNAIIKYGWNSFIPEILETGLTQDEANEKEIYYIAQYNSTNDKFGYNIATGGLNHNQSEFGRTIISQKAKERYKDKTKNPMYGKKHSQKTKDVMSEKKKGSKNPMYHRARTEKQRLCCTTKGKKLNLTDNQKATLREKAIQMGKLNSKSIKCIEDNVEFQSVTAAAQYYGVHISSICDQLKKRTKTCKGRHFIYL